MGPGPGAGGRSGPVLSASSPASTARLSVASSRSTRVRPRPLSLAMAADLLVELPGDRRGEGTDARRLDRPRLRDVDLPLPDDAARPGPEQHDPLPQPRGLADVVGDEHDRQPLLRPDPGELLVQHVA